MQVLKEILGKYPLSVTMVGFLLIAGAFHSCTSEAAAKEMPCAREARHAERVCRNKGQSSLECDNAWARYNRCMDGADPIDGIEDGC